MIEQDGIRWVEIGQAARLSRTKATIIGEAIAAGTIPSLVVDGKTWVPLTAANRLKRETAAMRSIERKSAVGDTHPAGGRPGPISAHREKQKVLPMSSGRRGRGWIG